VKRFGSGWGWLVLENGKVSVESTQNADTPIVRPGVKPLLTVDVWEHAYYLDWQNVRADYVKAVVNGCLNWGKASARFE
jgi:Fe-Mn family superoxide dismutase